MNKLAIIPPVIITSPQCDYAIYSPNGWQFNEPRAEQYEDTVKERMGAGIKSFTVYYNGLAVCGKIGL